VRNKIKTKDCTVYIFSKMDIITCYGQGKSVDYRHAIIEFDRDRCCFTLTDLGTKCGTYVNGNLLNNTTVSLACGNVICFGSFGLEAALFEVHITDTEV